MTYSWSRCTAVKWRLKLFFFFSRFYILILYIIFIMIIWFYSSQVGLSWRKAFCLIWEIPGKTRYLSYMLCNIWIIVFIEGIFWKKRCQVKKRKAIMPGVNSAENAIIPGYALCPGPGSDLLNETGLLKTPKTIYISNDYSKQITKPT